MTTASTDMAELCASIRRPEVLVRRSTPSSGADHNERRTETALVSPGDDSPWPPNDQRAVLLIALVRSTASSGWVWSPPAGRSDVVPSSSPAVAPLATLVWLATELGGLLDGETVTNSLDWVPELGIEIAARLDAFGAVMVLIVSVIGLAVLSYSWWYFAPTPRASPSDGGTGGHVDSTDRLAGLLDPVRRGDARHRRRRRPDQLFTAWELTSITSYLLIGVQHSRPAARAAALQALLITSAGGLVLLAGIVLIAEAAGHVQHVGDPRRPAVGHRRHRRAGLRGDRGVHEVGAVPVPLVAAGGDGRTDAGERLPALGDDGESRRLPHRALRAGVRPRSRRGGRSCSPSASSR